MKIKNSIYLLFNHSCFEVYYLEKEWILTSDSNIITNIVNKTPITTINIDIVYNFLLTYKLSIGRYYYGITGVTNSENKHIRQYFKNKFNGANNIGTKSIRLRFSKILLEYGERCFHDGYRPPIFKQDYRQAFKYFEESMKWWSYPSTLLMLAYCFTFEKGTKKDINKAIDLLIEVTETNSSSLHKQNKSEYYIQFVKGEAYFYLGYIYKNGINVVQDHLKAKEYFKQGQYLNNKNCIKTLDEYSINNRD